MAVISHDTRVVRFDVYFSRVLRDQACQEAYNASIKPNTYQVNQIPLVRSKPWRSLG